MDDIYSDIVDLTGARVAVYFPAEREQVGGLITRLLVEWDANRVFPGDSPPSTDRTFSGYAATHFRVRLRPQDLPESEQRYAAANIEVQVASVLMHAWAEIEHDLVYKPSEGKLSEAEYLLLDQLNGLVLTGELALEQLQKAGEARVAVGSRRFGNHYELAAHLLSQASAVSEQPITDSGLGRVDLLFKLLTRLELGTPDDLHPYLDLLHGGLERRPLSEQIIDALVAEDASRYQAYHSVRTEADTSRLERANSGEAAYTEIGAFLVHWAGLERLVLKFLTPEGQRRATMPTGRTLERAGLLNSEMSFEFDQLRRIRNELVHGVEVPPADYLRMMTQRVATLINEVERRLDSTS